MPCFRFFSDTSERAFLTRYPDSRFDDENCVELDLPDEIALARELGAFEEPAAYNPHSTSGVDAFLDTAAYCSRSRAELMPGCVPPPPQLFFGVKRRSTRGQPL